jgi:methyl-accepting chemotaxis protein
MAARTSIKRKLLAFSIVLFLVIFIAGNLAFLVSMQEIVRASKGAELKKLIQIESIKLESSVKGEIAIALKMAGSPLIQQYFANPADEALEKIAFKEIAGYRHAFASNTVFWVNDIDKKFYSDDAYAFTVNPEEQKNYWYKMTLYETEKFNFNINYNPELKKTMLWINAPVFEHKNSKKAIGILGTGIDLTSFTNSIYQNYSESADLYFFNSTGEITGAKDPSIIANKETLNKRLGKSTTEEILNRIKKLSPGAMQAFSVPEGEIAIGSVPAIDWYATAVQPLSTQDFLSNNMTLIFAMMMLVIAFIFVTFNVFLVKIFSPLKKTVDTLKIVSANFDLTQKIEGSATRDEIGDIAYSFNKLMEALKVPIAEAQAATSTLTSASQHLSEVSDRLSSSSAGMVNHSNEVASTVEQMSVNIKAMANGTRQASENANEVANEADQMSANMNTIAAAIEEMSASIREIAGNTGEVREITKEATNKANAATGVMNKLGESAKEIGQVTDVIKKIADKTNLLALNATIEAASAGESGKGFAVVANEIKELANQSAKNADDITNRIESIQSRTSNAIKVITDVGNIIVSINKAVENIAVYVEQQTLASNEIANNVTQANTGSKRVAGAISEVAIGSGEISQNAGEAELGAANVGKNAVNMNTSAKASAHDASEVNESASKLLELSLELKKAIVRFKI